MGLRDFLYPQLEVRLVLARALDVDEAHARQGSLSKDYQESAARITISSRDAQRLNLEEGHRVEVKSDIGQVTVRARLQENQPEGMVVMPPSPWAFAVINAMVPSQGTKVTIKPSKGRITPITNLP
jgi:formylmethanofuran dehydrogenase subunit D